MKYFAKVEDGIVTNVIVAEQEEIDSGNHGDPSLFVETCMEASFRGVYAGIGYTYDLENDIFVAPVAE